MIVKFPELVAVPLVFVTVIGPVAVPAGTVVVMVDKVEDTTAAAVPLSFTVFWLGVVLKPSP